MRTYPGGVACVYFAFVWPPWPGAGCTQYNQINSPLKPHRNLSVLCVIFRIKYGIGHFFIWEHISLAWLRYIYKDNQNWSNLNIILPFWIQFFKTLLGALCHLTPWFRGMDFIWYFYQFKFYWVSGMVWVRCRRVTLLWMFGVMIENFRIDFEAVFFYIFRTPYCLGLEATLSVLWSPTKTKHFDSALPHLSADVHLCFAA